MGRKSSNAIIVYRAPELTREQKGFLGAYYNNFGNIAEACRLVNVSRQTYYNWLKDSPLFKEHFDEAVESMMDNAEACVNRWARLDWKAAIALLERKRPKAYNLPTIQEEGQNRKEDIELPVIEVTTQPKLAKPE